MVHLMLSALIGAGFADFRAHTANRCGVFAPARHQCCSKAAGLGAVHVQSDALCHRGDVLFL
jgi:hypothetical protein